MTDEEKMKLWVETWKTAGPLLEQIRQEELRAMSEVQGTAVANGLLKCLHPRDAWSAHPNYTGLIEQQRIFKRWKR